MTEIHRDPIVTDKAKEAIILIAIIFLVIFLVGMILFNYFAKDGDGDKEVPLFADKIPTVEEVQILLVEAGYDIGPKGIDGDMGGDTIAAWDKAICDQYASKYDYMFEEVKK